jgi:hypothetical protein
MEKVYLVLKRASASRPSGEAHHEDRMPTHGYEPTCEPAIGGIREELAAGVSSKIGKSAFGGRPENIWSL